MSIDTDKQIAKELTLAVAAKMQVPMLETNKSTIDNQKIATEVSEMFKTIYAAVKG
jgi:hypothetical protein